MVDGYLPLYAWAFFSTLIITLFITKLLIPTLSSKAKQPIFEGGPAWHLKKSGTPTMGGLGFLVAFGISAGSSALFLFLKGEKYFALSLSLSGIYAILNGLTGFIDDYSKLKKKENQGLSAGQKLFIQSILAIAFLAARRYLLADSTKIYFSFGSFDLGLFYYVLSFIALLGTVNCANLTDGIDGLASGVAFAIGVSLFYISYSAATDVTLIASVLIGATLGFFKYNLNPAKIFMGDTGSLFLGALVSAAAISTGNSLILLFLGTVYFIEGLSVIIQVLNYKITGKRIFKMAPIHHHFEKCGWSENKIVLSAIFLTLIFSIPAVILFI